MLGNIVCWGIALCLMFTKTTCIEVWHTHLLMAMGFILLGILNKAIDAYYETHKSIDSKNNKLT